MLFDHIATVASERDLRFYNATLFRVTARNHAGKARKRNIAAKLAPPGGCRKLRLTPTGGRDVLKT